MLPLGQEDSKEGRKTRGRQTEQDEKSADTEKSDEEPQKKKGGLIRGIFGF
jgi:hypothetical protein